MKIYTKKGDTGTTQLLGGKRVAKDHHRIEAYGTVDELNSWLGLIGVRVNDDAKRILKEIQDRLFTLGAMLANEENKASIKIPDLNEADVVMLENEIDKMESALPELKSFVLAGGNDANAMCHIARCVCRRAERLTVSLNQTEQVDPLALKYLNRLSDYLFVLARKTSFDSGTEEVLWQPRKK